MMKTSILMALIALICCSISPVQEVLAQGLDRDIHYAGALASFDRGDYDAASEALELAIKCDPMPQSDDDLYIPYVHLAAASFESGQFAAARAALVQSQVYAVAPKTKQGASLLAKYGEPIMEVDLKSDELQYAANYFNGQNQSYSLSQEEADKLRSRALRRCAVASDAGESNLPWYFHYEYGLDLIEAGDSQRALEVLTIGAGKRAHSGRDKRMYGMWFIDYIPYYQMALAHSKLGDWESAHDAITMSRNFSEFSPNSSDYDEFTELEQLINSKLENGDT
jgi:tetratricopeptide (TPR) repeat protein